jgi:hypothetical protein
MQRPRVFHEGPRHHALLGRAYALAGEKRKALEILDKLKALSQQRYVSPFDIAVVQRGWTTELPRSNPSRRHINNTYLAS